MTNMNDEIERIGLGPNARKFKEMFEGQNSDSSRSIDVVVNQFFDTKFDFIERQKGEYNIFAIKGRVSNVTANLFKDKLYDAACEDDCRIIINLRDVSLIDSVGLGVLINTHKKADKSGGMVVFSNVPERIMNNMEMLYMDRYLHFAPDMKKAAQMMNW